MSFDENTDRYLWRALVGGAAWLCGIAAAGVYFGVWGALAVWVGAPLIVFGSLTFSDLMEQRRRARARRDHPAGSANGWGKPVENRWKT